MRMRRACAACSLTQKLPSGQQAYAVLDIQTVQGRGMSTVLAILLLEAACPTVRNRNAPRPCSPCSANSVCCRSYLVL